MKFDCGSLLQKLGQMQLCVQMAYKHLRLKPCMGCKVATYFSLQLQPKQLKWLGAGTYTASEKHPAR